MKIPIEILNVFNNLFFNIYVFFTEFGSLLYPVFIFCILILFLLDFALWAYSYVSKYSSKFLFFIASIQWVNRYLFIQLTFVEHVVYVQFVAVITLWRTSLNINLDIHVRFFLKKIIRNGINWLKILRLFICILKISPEKYNSSTWKFISSFSNNTGSYLKIFCVFVFIWLLVNLNIFHILLE